MARRHHNTGGDAARNLLNHSGLRLFALDGAGAVSAKVAVCALGQGKRILLNFAVL